MHTRLIKISTDALLTNEQVREVRAALSLAGLTQQQFAKKHRLQAAHLSKVVNQKYVPSTRYAKALNDLVADHLKPRVAA